MGSATMQNAESKGSERWQRERGEEKLQKGALDVYFLIHILELPLIKVVSATYV